jgi:3-oxoacyl-[acyl-carrier protein] reductase
MIDLNGKVAIVTGGTKGIGLAIAQTLLASGSSVFICARSAEEVEECVKKLSSQGKIAGKACDVRDEDSVLRLLNECEQTFGGIDILVNNAGIGIMGRTVAEITPDEFRATLETNLFGVYYACHYAIPRLKARGGGYIINISSLAGQNPHPKMAAYNASKYALNGFTEAMMQEVRQDNIKVSYICPGSVNTAFGNDTPSSEKAWQIQPEDIAQIVIGLLQMDPRTLPSKVEVRPSKPPVR